MAIVVLCWGPGIAQLFLYPQRSESSEFRKDIDKFQYAIGCYIYIIRIIVKLRRNKETSFTKEIRQCIICIHPYINNANFYFNKTDIIIFFLWV